MTIENLELFLNDVMYDSSYFDSCKWKWRQLESKNDIRLYRGRKLYCIISLSSNNHLMFDFKVDKHDLWFEKILEKFSLNP